MDQNVILPILFTLILSGGTGAQKDSRILLEVVDGLGFPFPINNGAPPKGPSSPSPP